MYSVEMLAALRKCLPVAVYEHDVLTFMLRQGSETYVAPAGQTLTELVAGLNAHVPSLRFAVSGDGVVTATDRAGFDGGSFTLTVT